MTPMTTEVTLTTRGGLAWADSREVAKSFAKQHGHVLRDIQALITQHPDLEAGWFVETHTPHPAIAGATVRHFEMTRDGFSLLAMG